MCSSTLQLYGKWLTYGASPYNTQVYRKWPAEFNYTAEAPKGHLPLTNALRGTQLFQAVLEHPAFEKKAVKSIDERSKEAGLGQMNF